MVVRVIGDVHCKINEYFDVLDDLRASYDDADLRSIQIGDMGFEREYRQRLRYLENNDRYDADSHVFFGGNHDDYDAIEWADALGDFGSVPWLSDGFFVRGARSIDENQRLEGHDYWDDEELSWRLSNKAIEEYIKMEPRYMFSHDCPGSVAERMFEFGEDINSHTSNLFNEMFSQYKPQRWFFGHWHEDATEVVSGTEFTCLGELSYIDLKT